MLKDVNRTAAALTKDSLLRSEARQEVRASDQKLITKTYYYLDFKGFVDVVKWRTYMMRKGLEDAMRNEAERKGYRCSRCTKAYTALEFSGLMNMRTQVFECEVCNAEIVEHDDSEKSKATQETLSQLMVQTEPIVRLLKMTDTVTIPRFEPLEYLKQKQAFTALSSTKDDGNDALSNAYTASSNPSSGAVNVEIQIEDEETAASRMASHALPSWHTHSTVTGEHVQGALSSATPVDSVRTAEEPLGTTDTDSITQYYQHLQSSASILGTKRAASDGEEEGEEEEDGPNLIRVSVGGVQKALSDITGDDKARMTPDEYAKYYEAHMESLE